MTNQLAEIAIHGLIFNLGIFISVLTVILIVNAVVEINKGIARLCSRASGAYYKRNPEKKEKKVKKQHQRMKRKIEIDVDKEMRCAIMRKEAEDNLYLNMDEEDLEDE